jgi:hypothetical protein
MNFKKTKLLGKYSKSVTEFFKEITSFSHFRWNERHFTFWPSPQMVFFILRVHWASKNITGLLGIPGLF